MLQTQRYSMQVRQAHAASIYATDNYIILQMLL